MSYGGNADPSGVQVTFLDQTGAKSVKAVIAFSVPVSRIIPNIITKMSLPATSPDGQPMSYSLDHKEGGRRLLESWTLVEANVRDGDHLIVYPEVVAGRSFVKAWSAEARIIPGRLESNRPRPDAMNPEALTRRGHSQSYAPISSHSPSPQRPGGPGTPSFGKLGLSLHGHGRSSAAIPHHFRGKKFVARSRQSQSARTASSRDQAGGVVSTEHTRDSLVDPDLPPQYFRDRHGVSGRVRHALGSQRAARRSVRDALGHGPLPQLRHSQPIQSRVRALGCRPDQLSVSNRCPPAPRPASLTGAG